LDGEWLVPLGDRDGSPRSVGSVSRAKKVFIDIFEVKEIAITGGNRFASFMRSPASEIVNLVNESYRGWGEEVS
jgi:hypothetical protein